MAKKEIKFNKSMNIDKRNEGFAYLRKNLGSVDTMGLYPAVDFVQATGTDLLDNDVIYGIAGTRLPNGKSPYVFVKRGTSLHLFETDGTATVHTPKTSTDVSAIANGTDGVYYVNKTDLKVYRPLYAINVWTEIGTFPSTPSVEIGLFDGLHYWWIGSNIWRQLPGQNPELILSSTPFSLNIISVASYKDYIVIFAKDQMASGTNKNVLVYFFDKKNSTFFYKRISMKNRTMLAGANLGETLTIVYSEATIGISQEQRGRIVVAQWSGENFVEINSIKTGNYVLELASTSLPGQTSDFNSKELVFSVRNNISATGSTDLYQNYLYKVDNKGRIEVLSKQPLETPDNISGVHVGFDFITYWLKSEGTNPPYLYNQQMPSQLDWNNYINFTQAEYITNFYCNPYNRHKLNAVNISAEKLFKAGTEETLDVYYRTSEREDWTLLGNITTTKVLDNVNLRKDSNSEIPISQQRYQFTKMPDLTSLPEFNEIQFKFNSKNGFSVIGAWFEYENLTRDTVK